MTPGGVDSETPFDLNLQRNKNYKFHILVNRDEKLYLEVIDEVEDIGRIFNMTESPLTYITKQI